MIVGCSITAQRKDLARIWHRHRRDLARETPYQEYKAVMPKSINTDFLTEENVTEVSTRISSAWSDGILHKSSFGSLPDKIEC